MSSNNPVNLYEKFSNLQYVSPGYKVSWISVKLKKVNKTKTERCFCLRLQRKRHELCACFSFSQLGGKDNFSLYDPGKKAFFFLGSFENNSATYLVLIPYLTRGASFTGFVNIRKFFRSPRLPKELENLKLTQYNW